MPATAKPLGPYGPDWAWESKARMRRYLDATDAERRKMEPLSETDKETMREMRMRGIVFEREES